MVVLTPWAYLRPLFQVLAMTNPVSTGYPPSGPLPIMPPFCSAPYKLPAWQQSSQMTRKAI